MSTTTAETVAPPVPAQRPQGSHACECGEPRLPGSQYGRDCLAADSDEALHQIQRADRRTW